MSVLDRGSRVAILGAGIAGASAARALADQGIPATVFDKGRVPGGRAATRSRGTQQHDFGAQYFTARDPRFVQQVRAWVDRAVVDQWQPRLVAIGPQAQWSQPGAETRWVGTPGMNSLAASLLEGLDLRCGQRVVRVERRDSGWWLELADAPSVGPYAAVLCTFPAPQAAQLLAGEALGRRAAEIAFAPCWALMVEFAEDLAADFDAAFINTGPLSWLARDASKPGRPIGQRWLVHAGSRFSREQLEASAEGVTGLMLDALFEVVGSAPLVPTYCAAHRWRHALAEPALELGALIDTERRLALGGDWCHGSRIEGAWLSGQVLARHVQEWVA